MKTCSDKFDIEHELANFKYADFLTPDEAKFLGTPTSVNDVAIPEENYVKRMYILMHQTITEKKLWNRLDDASTMYLIKGPKIDDEGHTGFTFHFAYSNMQTIASSGWQAWINSFAASGLEI